MRDGVYKRWHLCMRYEYGRGGDVRRSGRGKWRGGFFPYVHVCVVVRFVAIAIHGVLEMLERLGRIERCGLKGRARNIP